MVDSAGTRQHAARRSLSDRGLDRERFCFNYTREPVLLNPPARAAPPLCLCLVCVPSAGTYKCELAIVCIGHVCRRRPAHVPAPKPSPRCSCPYWKPSPRCSRPHSANSRAASCPAAAVERRFALVPHTPHTSTGGLHLRLWNSVSSGRQDAGKSAGRQEGRLLGVLHGSEPFTACRTSVMLSFTKTRQIKAAC